VPHSDVRRAAGPNAIYLWGIMSSLPVLDLAYPRLCEVAGNLLQQERVILHHSRVQFAPCLTDPPHIGVQQPL
jgi:hypothetical protein